MEKSEVLKELKNLIEGQTEKKIKDENQDIDIDSFTMMLVITFAHQKLNIKLDMDKLDFDQFKSLNDLADVIIASK
mgnify:FL=1|jgi:acyl carrier protein|tara:strand:+ start:83 stop:310 length:228 start_codon:yes stop_codon:yes gene_type:complete